MSYQRLYPQRINWEDEPSLATPINQVNLNKMDSALYGIDGRVVELDEGKVGKTETFNTSRNGVVPKPTQADITNEKVLRADGVWVEQSGGGGGGGGHTIVNNAGTSLQQRGKLKTVGGLNASDDSENNTTKITDEYEIIPWTTWQGYTAAQKAQHPNAIVTDAPDCDGDIEIENMHLAWTNQNPNTAFANQEITLDVNDADYDFIKIKFKIFYSDTSFIWRTFKKCENNYAETNDLANLRLVRRAFNYNSGVKYQFGSGVIRDTFSSSGQPADDGRYLIPIEIYTFKKKLTAKIKAIAHDVSTSASKCMMSDEQTSVEEMLEDSGWKTLASSPIECTYRRIGKIVYIQCSARNITVSTASVSLGTLPQGYRPVNRTCVRNGYLSNNDCYLEIIPSDGSCTVNFPTTGSGKYIHLNTSYPID